MSMQFTIIRPGGNDTCLVFGTITDKADRKRINDAIMRAYPAVEQVGFISESSEGPSLMMAGGEFCGNATRSAAALLLGMAPGRNVQMNVSGVNRLLTAGLNEKGYAYAEMPVYPDPQRIVRVAGTNSYIVEMEGITQYVILDSKDTSAISDAEIKRQAFDLLVRNNLTDTPAAGVMYATRQGKTWKLDPVVYVRDIDTLFRETACGSGTTALGMVLALLSGGSVTDVEVQQPSEMPISVSVNYDGMRFNRAVITGPVMILRQGTIEITNRFAYVTEQIRLTDEVEALLDTGDLAALYSRIFRAAPYYESFTTEEIRRYFMEYATQGLLYIARIDDTVIGFGAAVPLWLEPEIRVILSDKGIDPDSSWYMADLGVDERYRRSGVGRNLVTMRMNAMPKGSIVIMRTSVNNGASQALYRKLGFMPVEGAYQQVRQTRIDGSAVEDTRLFLAKQIV